MRRPSSTPSGVGDRRIPRGGATSFDFRASYATARRTYVMCRVCSIHPRAAVAYASFMMKAFDLSVGVFVRGLTNLKVLLTKGEEHASSRGVDPISLLSAQLADDMYT